MNRLVSRLRSNEKFDALYCETLLRTGQATSSVSAEAYAIFNNAYETANAVSMSPYSPSEEELQLLRSQNLLSLFERYRDSALWVKELNYRAGIFNRSAPKTPQRWFITKLLNVLIPVLPNLALTRARRIYADVAQNQELLLSEKDRRFLHRYALNQDLERFRKDLTIHPKSYARLSRARVIGNKIKWTIATSVTALALMGTGNYISANDSFNESHSHGMSRYDDKVEIIFLSPMPHASLRIGGLIYNYGVFSINRFNFDQFRSTVGFGNHASGSHTRVTLNLTDDERERLQDYLETQVGKVYPLIIPYNDCISMTNGAIRRYTGINVPVIADRSQAGTLAYYHLLQLLGSERVREINFASRNDNTLVSRGAEAVVNFADISVFLSYGPSLFLLTPLLDRQDLTREVE